MSASPERFFDEFAARIWQATESLSSIFATGHALSPSVEAELKAAVGALRDQANLQLEHSRPLSPGHALHEQQVVLQEFNELKGRIIRAIHRESCAEVEEGAFLTSSTSHAYRAS